MESRKESFIQEFSSLFIKPSRLMQCIFTEKKTPKQVIGSLVFIAVEIFVMVACFEYWWFGQLYFFATLLIFTTLFVVACIPTLSWKKNTFGKTMKYHSLLLILPSITSCVIIVLFRLGYVDYIDRYLYRSPLLVSIFAAFVIFTLIWKGWCRAEVNKDLEPNVKIIQFIIMYFIDIAIFAGIILFFLNYEGIYNFLQTIS